MATSFVVNGRPASTDAPPATPLLWVIREQLKLTGTKFGCGTGLCGACTIHIDGKRAFSCQTQVSEVAGKSVTTIEGLSPELEPSAAEGLARRAGAAMRLLPVRPDHERGGVAQGQSEAEPRADRRAHDRQHLPLRDLPAHCQRRRARRAGGLSHDQAHQTVRIEHEAVAPAGDDRRRWAHVCIRALRQGSARRRGGERTRRQGDQSVALDRARRHHHHHVGGDRDGAGLDDLAAADPRRGARRRLGEGAHRAGAADRPAVRQSLLRHDLHRRQQCGAGLLPAVARVRRAGASRAARQRRETARCAGRGTDHRAQRGRSRQVEPPARLRRDRRLCGDSGQGARDHAGAAQEAERVPPDRQGRDARRGAGQGERHRAIRHRRAGARDALRRGAARAGGGRRPRADRRDEGARRRWCRQDRPDALRRRRGRRNAVGGVRRQARARRQCHMEQDRRSLGF